MNLFKAKSLWADLTLRNSPQNASSPVRSRGVGIMITEGFLHLVLVRKKKKKISWRFISHTNIYLVCNLCGTPGFQHLFTKMEAAWMWKFCLCLSDSPVSFSSIYPSAPVYIWSTHALSPTVDFHPPSPPLQWIELGSGPFGQWSRWQLWQHPDFTLLASVTSLYACLILIM